MGRKCGDGGFPRERRDRNTGRKWLLVSPRQDAVSEAPLLQQQEEEEEVFRDDGLGVDGPHQATQVPEGESGKGGQSTAPQGTQGAKIWVCVQCHLLDMDLRKAHISPRSPNPPFWPYPFLLESNQASPHFCPFHTEPHPIPAKPHPPHQALPTHQATSQAISRLPESCFSLLNPPLSTSTEPLPFYSPPSYQSPLSFYLPKPHPPHGAPPPQVQPASGAWWLTGCWT